MELIGLLNYAVFMAIFIGIYSLLALGLNIQWGFSGLFNAGIAGFFAVGAYSSALLTAPESAVHLGGYQLPVVVGWIGAMVAAGAIAWPIGKVCLRFRSDYLAIATIGVAEIIRLVVKSEGWMTGGARGVNKIPRPFGDLSYLYSQLAYLALVFAIVLVVYWAIERQISAPWGRMMRGIRDNEDAATAMGKDIKARRLEAFIFGAAVMGLGGALFAHFNRSITPEAIDPMIATFLIWIMLILGGSGNNRGALLGVAVVWIIWSASEFVTDQLPTEYAIKAKYMRVFIIGLLLQLVLRFRPEGILPEPQGTAGSPEVKTFQKQESAAK
ncbi:leucine/isoleucine/valine transporter permease subunit [Pseudovibrio sp. W64]|uniref:branched-chain amino acid ABC transporter permease n=1 Tax=Pseudovibrio TaxID=258255 RepID=UPI000708D645|nr:MULTISPECIES: branched-chain amino acid ABC transporter permease [Pseudovibrio]KZK75549.1 leucine/isoleucine/valine transporter permease subunit [Pseudovibrio sp. W64]KZK93912.1 leucine/isoleucine/valine transporter permease subunit [Pseudovibrio sp. Ad46]KZL01248.1 leucine/isoleucine/valine transporter permease subunit [Pseudovibrio sp. W74]KZL11313.1 leucine/isoleucine/valine transporter permease subunit [Pseudovibrio sp. Ad14]